MSDYNWKTLEASAEEPIWIRSEADLSRYCNHWRTLPLVALDTEFIRVETFYPIAGLIQVADDRQCYLIDPLDISDFSALSELFQDRSVIKLMHAATEDLELFLKVLGVLPQPVFDTQIGAALLNWGFSMGLQRMLEQKLDVQMEKHETTSDWLKRPLTSSQIHYAALDVAYLPEIYAMQKQEFVQRDTYSWAEQENQKMLDNALIDDVEGYDYYLRFTQMWRCPVHKLAALRDLTAWREQVARDRDVPRNRILKNQALLQIIEAWPRNMGDLSRLDEIRKHILRSDGETILGFIRSGSNSAEANPPKPIPRPLHYFWNKHLKKLKAIARKAAEANDVAPEILLRRKELELLIRSGVDEGEYRLPSQMSEWRQKLIGPALLDELEVIERLRCSS
ncbi:ribonuclease D [Neptuniibacter sp. 1_MG-2023]|uniref:ribonuclease D n=1 Tax=Neptuniibacter sp. 1_MG-2023 TaxID=3062662 RepID=UPI0026E1FD06|nr:ribonuclease D [Neptuniibacter sp. 1_MG-2023]MDO6593642.1 ribonuclease D [Neptuniibacter sp. 1_MG-2023]